MHGGGNKLANTANSPPARCLDVTRLVSRAGRRPLTGIDRVELEYFRRLLNLDTPLFVLILLNRRIFLLDSDAAKVLLAELDAIVRSRTKDRDKNHLQSMLVKLAFAQSWLIGLTRLLASHLPAGTSFVNVGHQNLSSQYFKAIKSVPKSHLAVMIHDAIPLDLPALQPPGVAKKFTRKLKATAKHADLLILNSTCTQMRVAEHLSVWDIPFPDSATIHFGIEVPVPDASQLPDGLTLIGPYFVTVGTIEPRKDHAFLLDVWEELQEVEDAPHLYIVGARGWQNQHVFDRLDGDPKNVTELNDLSDAGLAALIEGSAGVLHPSISEGFGFPPAEAVALGIPVICSDLAVYEEILGEIPVYATTSDMYLWVQTIKKMAEQKKNGCMQGKNDRAIAALPTWKAHFNVVLNLV